LNQSALRNFRWHPITWARKKCTNQISVFILYSSKKNLHRHRIYFFSRAIYEKNVPPIRLGVKITKQNLCSTLKSYNAFFILYNYYYFRWLSRVITGVFVKLSGRHEILHSFYVYIYLSWFEYKKTWRLVDVWPNFFNIFFAVSCIYR